MSSSLLNQMRPWPSEEQDRRHGPRKYHPEYNLYRHITLPTPEEMRDPKPKPLPVRAEEYGTRRVYTTPYGQLSGDVTDQFARHCQWKTQSQLNYVPHLRPVPPAAAKLGYEPRADMVKLTNLGRRDPNGPYDYQKIVASGGQLPEAKAWPSVHKEYAPFPKNTFPVTKFFREVRHNIGGRTPEDYDVVKNHIRDLVKQKALNPQFVKPMPHYQGVQDQVRLYEPLRRPPGRNPPNMVSEHMAQFGRHIPSTEYRRPEFGALRPLANTVTQTKPYSNFNKAEHPDSLDYLPMPWTYTDKPTDLRLVTGYNQ